MPEKLRDGNIALRARGLTKRFGKTQALKGIDLEVERGTVFSLLGPNGAGKTTAVRIMTTLLLPDSGDAEVAGFNVLTETLEARYRLGLAGQQAAVDEYMTGRANLEMVGRLYHLPPAEARRRSDALIEAFELGEFASRLVKTYSGGMRRRLDLAASLVGEPEVLFLDEPTTGLDPFNRNAMWETIRGLVRGGTTILLTTQYLEEADRLADRIAVIDRGLVVGLGTSQELKRSVGGERVDIRVAELSELPQAREAMEAAVGHAAVPGDDPRAVSVPAEGGAATLMAVMRAIDERKIALDDIGLRQPTLDDVFMHLTGHAALGEDPKEAAQGGVV